MIASVLVERSHMIVSVLVERSHMIMSVLVERSHMIVSVLVERSHMIVFHSGWHSLLNMNMLQGIVHSEGCGTLDLANPRN